MYLFKLKNIETNSEEFVNKMMMKNKWDHKLFKNFHILLNILVIMGAFTLVVLSTLIISKLVWSGWPVWYYYFTSALSAFTTFTSLIINLFVVEKKILKTKIINQKIQAELAFYSSSKGQYKLRNKKHKEYLLFHNITKILKYKIAIEEDKHETKINN